MLAKPRPRKTPSCKRSSTIPTMMCRRSCSPTGLEEQGQPRRGRFYPLAVPAGQADALRCRLGRAAVARIEAVQAIRARMEQAGTAVGGRSRVSPRLHRTMCASPRPNSSNMGSGYSGSRRFRVSARRTHECFIGRPGHGPTCTRQDPRAGSESKSARQALDGKPGRSRGAQSRIGV